MNRLRTVVAISVLSLASFGAGRTLTGLEGAINAADQTNGGFWDVAERISMTVDDGEAAIGKAIDISGGSSDTFLMDALDARAFTWEESEVKAIRTDPFIGLRIILQ